MLPLSLKDVGAAREVASVHPTSAHLIPAQLHFDLSKSVATHKRSLSAPSDLNQRTAWCLAAVTVGAASRTLTRRAQAFDVRRPRCVACRAEVEGDDVATRAFVATESDPTPCAAGDLSIAELLKWARTQSSLKVHPALVARNGKLVVSMPVASGTPLVGVMPGCYLGEKPSLGNDASEKEAECQTLMQDMSDPELWPYRLAVRLLKEQSDDASPWQSYTRSLMPRPPAPLLWSPGQANELQYIPIKRTLKEQLLEYQSTYDEHLKDKQIMGANVDRSRFAALVANAMARGVEVNPGHYVLMPLLDMVGPPEAMKKNTKTMTSEEVVYQAIADVTAPGVTDEVEPASCNLQVEGGEEGLAFLTAARDLNTGDELTRDHSLSSDELLLRHGVAAMPKQDEEMALWTGIKKSSIQKWQARAIQRVCEMEDGPAGSVVIKSKVRRGKTFKESIDKSLIYSIRVLAARREKDLYGAEEWQQEDFTKKPMDGMDSEQRRSVILLLENAIDGYRKTFDTTVAEDKKELRTVKGNIRVAVTYRLSKKRVLDELDAILERIKDKEVGKRAKRKQESGLPSAVTGKKAPKATPQQRGFGVDAGDVYEDGDVAKRDGATVKKLSIVTGCRVELLQGKFKGKQGTVMRDPDAANSVSVKLDDGKEIDFIKVDICQRVKSWLDVEPEEPEPPTIMNPFFEDGSVGFGASNADRQPARTSTSASSAIDTVLGDDEDEPEVEVLGATVEEVKEPDNLQDADVVVEPLADGLAAVEAETPRAQDAQQEDVVAEEQPTEQFNKDELTQRLLGMLQVSGGQSDEFEKGLQALEDCLQNQERERMLDAMRAVGVDEGKIRKIVLAREVIQRID